MNGEISWAALTYTLKDGGRVEVLPGQVAHISELKEEGLFLVRICTGL